MDKFYVTTPLYYVNDKPHIGHTYTTVLADVLARYYRFMGVKTFFLTGTDEHGQKVAQAAEKRGIDCKDYCDEYAQYFKDMWMRMHIKYDHFIRTTDEHHEKAVTQALQKLWDIGDIYLGSYKGWYCVYEERFWTEKDLINGKLCPDCNRPTNYIEEKSYFFKMSKYQDWLIEHIEKHPEFIKPDFRRNEVLGFLRKPLGDLCISRPKARLRWGVELPFDRDFVTYVWVDALLNYCTAVGLWDNMSKFNEWWPADYHLIGKDILTTHTVYWPCILKALGITMPRTIFAHGWWLIGKAKMGKSLGNAIDPAALVDSIGAERLRYYLIRDMVLGQDSTYTLDGLISRLNNDLSNDLGNMLSRVTNMVVKYFDGVLPAPNPAIDNEIIKLLIKAEGLTAKIKNLVLDLKTHQVLEEINSVIRAANKFIENTKPWKLAAEGENARLANVLYHATQLIARVGLLLYPVIPEKSIKLLNSLGFEGKISLDTASEDEIIKPGSKIIVTKPLFPRIDIKKIEKELGVETVEKIRTNDEKTEGLIEINDFSKIKLVVGKIVECNIAPKSENLLLLKVDTGEKIRQLVAGIAKWYKSEELVGKSIIVITNLKPVKIRGYVSEGMLLAADDGRTVSILMPDKALRPGCKIR